MQCSFDHNAMLVSTTVWCSRNPKIYCDSINRLEVWKNTAPRISKQLDENCLVLSPICLITSTNSLGFNRLLLLIEVEDFLRKALFQDLQKRNQNNKQSLPLLCFPAIMTLGCVHVSCLPGRMESPRISYYISGKTFFTPPGNRTC